MVDNKENEWEVNEPNNEPPQSKFLIYIINQEIELNEEAVTITFFKDITFGILYEQMTAQDDIKKILTNHLDQKIGQKLKKLSENVTGLNKSLLEFQDEYPAVVEVSK